MSKLPSLTVEEYSTTFNHCEFTDECDGEIAYTVTPPTHQQDSRVHPDDEFTTFVCWEHLAPLIALRLAGKYDVEDS